MDGRYEHGQRWAVLVRPTTGNPYLLSDRQDGGTVRPAELTLHQAHDVITRLMEHGWRCDCPVECECIRLGDW